MARAAEGGNLVVHSSQATGQWGKYLASLEPSYWAVSQAEENGAASQLPSLLDPAPKWMDDII
jgi:hypothetical protein